jgi:hypothetical protein
MEQVFQALIDRTRALLDLKVIKTKQPPSEVSLAKEARGLNGRLRSRDQRMI